ncbi:MAG: hypothetical protein H0V49_07030 [Nocardioidaceae bacterium]|nr:hypothetical protein [Nocardioidaceae bacterium]
MTGVRLRGAVPIVCLLILVALVEYPLARIGRILRVPLVILPLTRSVHILGLVLVEDALAFVVVLRLTLVEDAVLVVFVRLILGVVVVRPRSRRIACFGIV